mmetsp:Transcript_148825/g.262837  ORF Transcript_148825/g.262837 Transcript_148825/m.262837 type:complete len:248 (+) Transcript_148825:830-1573(+)
MHSLDQQIHVLLRGLCLGGIVEQSIALSQCLSASEFHLLGEIRCHEALVVLQQFTQHSSHEQPQHGILVWLLRFLPFVFKHLFAHASAGHGITELIRDPREKGLHIVWQVEAVPEEMPESLPPSGFRGVSLALIQLGALLRVQEQLLGLAQLELFLTSIVVLLDLFPFSLEGLLYLLVFGAFCDAKKLVRLSGTGIVDRIEEELESFLVFIEVVLQLLLLVFKILLAKAGHSASSLKKFQIVELQGK